MSGRDTEEFLLEFHQIGGSVKVSALDPVSGEEVSIIGPATLSQTELGRQAVNKLRYVLARRRGATPGDKPPPADGRGGIVV